MQKTQWIEYKVKLKVISTLYMVKEQRILNLLFLLKIEPCYIKWNFN